MFITTEPLNVKGEGGEKLVWEAIQSTFYQRKCLAYWRYPIFSQRGKFRKEPDILIADFELGLIIIEVKSITLDQIVNIQGHRWEYQNFYINFGNPYQQGENQLFALLEYLNQEPDLKHKVTAKVLVALPFIQQEDWKEKGFDQLPSCPPIIFKNHLFSSRSLEQLIQQTSPLISGQVLTDQQWELLLSILSGTPVFTQATHKVLSHEQSRGKILQQVKNYLYKFDLQQEKIAKQIPPGCQRIRGIAGSGKTVLLCQKAAIMHLKYPQWRIAFIFFSRSLYQEIIEQIDQWVRYFSCQQKIYNKNNQKLQVFHAWGSREQLGFYRLLCQVTGVMPLGVNQTTFQPPNEALGEVCIDLLKQKAIPQLFDAILIDEGQDLMVENWLYEGKQPFYWLAYQSLRPINSMSPQQRRLIWAYDELQSLESLKVPNASEIFGENLGNLVTGKYSNNINKTEIMSRCYRTPHQLILVAHGMGMGWLRPQGMLTGMSNQEDWKSLGYDIKGNLMEGEKITLKRPQENSPHPLASLWKDSLIQFNTYLSRQQEISALSQQIKHNLRQDGLRPSKEILVIVLGEYFESVKLQKTIATFLIRQGVDIYIPGTKDCNCLTVENHEDANQFWCEGAVTISRIYRVKGQESDMIYIVGLDHLAQKEDNLFLRNQLFIAITRSRGWVNLSGIGNYLFYQEFRNMINSKDSFTFIYTNPQQREIIGTEAGELLHRYRLGERNFQQAELSNVVLENLNLDDINLIGANLSGANLQYSKLNRAKLIAADLQKANLQGASLVNAKLMGANLRDANLTNTNLTNADLTDAILNSEI
ncbi:pentapeptide repeat-containing protein [Crocosphaera sp. XPORK-15E]|uniref:pentapeptide repeat-containing protein n=1 Tax=Crocosphaera sp. XPORK-15E TaxID=3110247 RepID=UPI002B20EC36|nr:pentapeptide repeat-containing protein [Crocosphaera sp. XPORK-15E]MEA5537259.1 pentapeptide repeat-containing protein [Crocosphaera sp. XPORK-15E]